MKYYFQLVKNKLLTFLNFNIIFVYILGTFDNLIEDVDGIDM